MSVYNNENSLRYYDGSENETTIEEYDLMYKSCHENKSRSCIINFVGDTRRKVYLNYDDTLTINCKSSDVDGEKYWKLMYIKLNRGEWECGDCGERYDTFGPTQVDGECKECWYYNEIRDWKKDIENNKEKNAVKIISNRFLEWKYNPQYKYCRERVELLYDMEFNYKGKPRMFQKKRKLVIVK